MFHKLHVLGMNDDLWDYPGICGMSYGIESLSFLGYKLWNSLPEEFKGIKRLHH